jgi:hypothetical protein
MLRTLLVMHLVTGDRAVDASVEVRSLVVIEPLLVDVVRIDVGGTCMPHTSGR